MSTSYYCYLGPTIVCTEPNTIAVESQIEVRICQSANCTNKGKDIATTFCPNCGKKPAKQMRTTVNEHKVHFSEIEDEFQDELVDTFANTAVDTYSARLIENGVEDGIHIEPKCEIEEHNLGETNIATEIADFANKYAIEIEIFRKYYGKVEVQYLFFSYAN